MGRWHAHALRRLGIPVVAVCDPDPAAAERLARETDARVAPRLPEMLANTDFDVLHVCTPGPDHAFTAAAGLTAGCHVLVEKPLADNHAQVEALIESAKRHGVQLGAVHQFCFQPGFLRLERSLEALGMIRHLDFVTVTAGAAAGDEARRAAVVAEILPHPLSAFARLLPGDLAAASWDVARPEAGELRAVTVHSRATLSLLISTRGLPTQAGLRVVGDRMTAHLDFFHGFCTLESGPPTRTRKILRPLSQAWQTALNSSANLARRAWRREPAYPGLRTLVKAFHRAAHVGGAPPLPAAHLRQVASARDRILEVVAGDIAQPERPPRDENAPTASPRDHEPT